MNNQVNIGTVRTFDHVEPNKKTCAKATRGGGRSFCSVAIVE